MVAAAPILLATRSEFLKTNVVPVICDRHGHISKSAVNKIELSPDTATGASRFVPEVPSPTCAHHKASQPRQKPAHPTSIFPPPLLRNALAPARWCSPPSTISLQMIPQSHMCVSANVVVSSKHSKITNRRLPSQTHTISQIMHASLTPQRRSNPSHTARTPYALLNIKPHPNTPTANKLHQ